MGTQDKRKKSLSRRGRQEPQEQVLGFRVLGESFGVFVSFLLGGGVGGGGWRVGFRL